MKIRKAGKVGSPERRHKGHRLDFMIDFINPETHREDETDCEIEMDGKTAYKAELEEFWEDFCKSENWKAEEIDVTDIWYTLAEGDDG